MSALTAALRKKFKTPREAVKALGLDESLLTQETSMATKPTKFASLAALMAGTAVKPFLAKDAKVDLMPIFAGVTAKTWDPKKITMALDKALDGKLRKGAHDVTMKHVADLMDHIPGEKSMDESVSEPQHKAMEAAAHGHSTLGIPEKVGKEFAKADEGKDGYMKRAMDWMTENGMDAEMTEAFKEHMGQGAEDEEEELPEEVNEGERDPPADDSRHADDRRADDKRADDKGRFGKDRRTGKDKGRMGKDGQIVLTRQAFDEALAARDKSTTEKVAAAMRQEARDMRSAEALCKSKCGAFDALAFDSAEGMKRHALKVLGSKHWEKIDVSALDALLEAYPNAGARPIERLATDSASRSASTEQMTSLREKFPGLKNIKIGA
jgi:hypothetical protein